MEFSQHQRVPSIRLDPVTCLYRDERGRHYQAVMPAAGQQAMKPISARAGLVTEAQPATPFAETGRHPTQALRTVLKHPDLTDLAATTALGYRHAHRRLVHVQSDKSDLVH